MHAPQTRLGEATGSNIVAAIPDYSKELLLVDANVNGSGKAIGDYFINTPLRKPLGETLEELQIDGNVSGDLHLSIPLTGEQVTASGKVDLAKNSLLIKPIGVTVKELSGQFRYHNGNLDSDILSGQWLGQPLSVRFSTLDQPQGFDIKVAMQGETAMDRLPGLPEPMGKALMGRSVWQSDIAVSMPDNGKTTYQMDLTADLKNVSSHLPAPLDKPGEKAFPVTLKAQGGLTGFTLSGRTGKNNAFNSEWALGKQIALLRGAWAGDAAKVPPLPSGKSLTLDLPALDGEQWLGLMTPQSRSTGKAVVSRFRFPDILTLKTPLLTLGGQQWHDLSVTRNNTPSGSSIEARGREIDGKLSIADRGLWRADLRYLYYNPMGQQATDSASENVQDALFNDGTPSAGFTDWPVLQFRCQSCWMSGQNLGRVEADIAPQKNTLLLTNGLVDTGKSRLTLDGNWSRTGRQNQTSVKGKLSGNNIGEATDYIGMDTPLREAPFSVDYDLHWQATPWNPDIASLNGVLHSALGKGKIDDISSGQAGRLLRLVSFDALLRKLQFDFRDTFGKGFYFDSIKGAAWIKNGTLHTNDLLVDGLEADIAMNGQVDFNAQQIDMQAVIAPEISATVGVAAAFAINPVVGAAVFAASKVLAPLWNKISVIRYHITGSLDQPKIEEVLRQPRQPNVKGK